MRHSDLVYLLALRQCFGIGDITAKKLLEHFGSAQEVFRAKTSALTKIPGIGMQKASQIEAGTWLSRAEKEARFIEDHNIQCHRFDSESYPDRLRHCPDGPVLLFSKGNLCLENRKIISIVGTRKVTSAGLDFCRRLIADLAPLNPVIVSGYAYGVDIAAHLAALDHQLQTIGVLAHGLDQLYPRPHKKFSSRMMEQGGFLTEFCTWDNPEPENFVKRNRIVAGLSEATIVIESAEKGGSLITANLALDYNREVFAVPGRPSDPLSAGCNNLIKTQRAQMLTQAADLVYQLNWDLKEPVAVQKTLFPPMEAAEQIIYDFLWVKGTVSQDEMAQELRLSVQELSVLLLQMELKGILRSIPGRMFQVV